MDADRMRELLILAEEAEAEDELAVGFVDIEASLVGGDEYQLILMKDAGWVSGKDPTMGYFRLTFAGHEFLNATRDVGIWAKTKEVVAKEGGSATLDVIKALAIGLLRQQIENRTGLKL
ncbi:DUF2513 domain-containing protein [Thioclava pacifica]|nr:DUF2513 domain-containing protein [Thioclava pacifica]